MRTSTKLASLCLIAGAGCSQGTDSAVTPLGNGQGNSGTPSDNEGSGSGTQAGASPVPLPLAARLADLNACKSRLQDTHATLPAQLIQGEDGPAFLYAFYLIAETGLSNPFTTNVDGFNDQCSLPANSAIGAIRAVLEAKPGAVVDANDPRSLIDIFTDVCGLIVINNESGWYEGWIISDVHVPTPSPADPDGHAAFGSITQADADALKALGSGHDVPGALLTTDGRAPHGPSNQPVSGGTVSSNVVFVPVSLGAWNTLQGEDAHAYWELNQYTNFTFPLYEVPGVGALAGSFEAGRQYAPLGGIGPNVDSRIPGSGPSGVINNTSVAGKVAFGDNPQRPRDPDRTPASCGEEEEETTEGAAEVGGGDGEESSEAETRLRFLPSGLAREILLDVYARISSFESNITDPAQRYVDAYAFEVAKLDQNRDGVLQFKEVDIEGTSLGQPNTRLFIAPNQFNRVAVTREINDGLLAPRYFPTQQAFVLAGEGTFVPVNVPPAAPSEKTGD